MQIRIELIFRPMYITVVAPLSFRYRSDTVLDCPFTTVHFIAILPSIVVIWPLPERYLTLSNCFPECSWTVEKWSLLGNVYKTKDQLHTESVLFIDSFERRSPCVLKRSKAFYDRSIARSSILLISFEVLFSSKSFFYVFKYFNYERFRPFVTIQWSF